MAGMYRHKCVMCGKVFYNEWPQTVCCGAECKRQYKAWYHRLYKRRYALRKAADRRLAVMQTGLDATLAAARDADMSYGKFVAAQWQAAQSESRARAAGTLVK